jgi:hypothetical protein
MERFPINPSTLGHCWYVLPRMRYGCLTASGSVRNELRNSFSVRYLLTSGQILTSNLANLCWSTWFGLRQHAPQPRPTTRFGIERRVRIGQHAGEISASPPPALRWIQTNVSFKQLFGRPTTERFPGGPTSYYGTWTSVPPRPLGHFLLQKVAHDYRCLWLRFERQSRSLIPKGPVFLWVPDTSGRRSLSAISPPTKPALPIGISPP